MRGFGKVYQQIRMSYVPECARDLDCNNCSGIIDVKVKESLVLALTVTPRYIPNSAYQWIV